MILHHADLILALLYSSCDLGAYVVCWHLQARLVSSSRSLVCETVFAVFEQRTGQRSAHSRLRSGCCTAQCQVVCFVSDVSLLAPNTWSSGSCFHLIHNIVKLIAVNLWPVCRGAVRPQDGVVATTLSSPSAVFSVQAPLTGSRRGDFALRRSWP